ncbi:MAG: elongation factor P maturation arginine rhamnosyltransferase EarP [Rubrivivax sp.]|nr:elongation factor P maturation arginine rhamnosyltransferase EarP [Rubrivivax sp.]
MAPSTARTWDLFCRLVDNLGDVGVSWRLACDLAARGERVRLWVDDRAPLNFMAPHGAPGVEVHAWPAQDTQAIWPEPGDVVIETFGCELPAGFVQAMAERRLPPVWLNLEYLSAEDFVERSHALPSPQRNGLPKWFFYPGFSLHTGGLLRETGLLQARGAFDREAWLGRQGIRLLAQERVVLVFCYTNPALESLLFALADRPTLLLLTPGPAQKQVHDLAPRLPRLLRFDSLPWLTQPEFDQALWSSDLNLVRGEDSLVRAIWAGAPLLWQLYPQEPEVRSVKLEAWLKTALADTQDAALAAPLGKVYRQYNGLHGHSPRAALRLPEETAWQAQAARLQQRLGAQADLVTRLQGFVNSHSA